MPGIMLDTGNSSIYVTVSTLKELKFMVDRSINNCNTVIIIIPEFLCF